jgi:hypothetical protein
LEGRAGSAKATKRGAVTAPLFIFGAVVSGAMKTRWQSLLALVRDPWLTIR